MISGSHSTDGCTGTLAPTVSFGALSASTSFVAGSQINASAPANTPGSTLDITVTNCAGVTTATSSADRYTTDGAVPMVTSLTPTTGTAGTAVTITGSGFIAGCGGEGAPSAGTVNFGSVAATVGSSSDTSLSVTAPSNTAGSTVHVTVTDCNGNRSVAVTQDQFTYTGTSGPVVTSVSPSSGVARTTVTISGSGFMAGCTYGTPANALGGGTTPTVRFGGTPATFNVAIPRDIFLFSEVIDTELQVVVPTHGAGAVAVTVTNCFGDTSVLTPADVFTYVVPVVTKVSPSSGVAGTIVDVSGSGFMGGCTYNVVFNVGGTTPTVRFGGTPAAFNPLVPGRSLFSVTDTGLQVVAPAHGAGPAAVTVTDCVGQTSVLTSAGAFTYAGPVVTSVGILAVIVNLVSSVVHGLLD
jgi:hypothetical protein